MKALRRLVVLGMLAGAVVFVGRKLGIIGGNDDMEYDDGDFASTYEDEQQAGGE